MPIARVGWTSICWSPALSLFVAVANDASGTTIASSDDGIIWTERDTTAGDWQAVEWAEALGRFVVIGKAAPHAMWSSDGVTWTATIAPVRNWSFLAFAPKLGKFVALDASSRQMMQSTDGKNWAEHATSVGGVTSGWESGLTWSEDLGLFATINRFIADRKIRISADGIDWSNVYSLGYSNETNVVAGAGGLGFGT